MSYLRLENIYKKFGENNVFSSLNLNIEEGTFFVILGPSGCGKSTLLNIIAGLENPDKGRIYLNGNETTKTPPHKRDIAMVFQNYALYPHLTVFENMAFGLKIRKIKKSEIITKVKNVSKILNIEDKLNNYPKELSGGQKQRVATGRAIVREPDLFLFDEPLSNLDAKLRAELRSEFKKLQKRLKKTIIYVTHDQIEAMSLGDKIVVINKGKIQQISSPEKLYKDPANLFVAEFIGSPQINTVKMEVKNIENTACLKKGDFKFKLPGIVCRSLINHLEKPVYFGIRPSNIKIIDDGLISGMALFTETVGEDNYVRLELSNSVELNAKIPDGRKITSGDKVYISIDTSKAFFFDEAGTRISVGV